MLQEIINKIAVRLVEPGKTAYKRFQDLFYDVTVGLAREYQRKTLELARITAASYYLQAVKLLRQAAITLFCVTLASVVFAVAVVVVPVVLVLMSPLSATAKWWTVAGLGVLDAAAALVYLSFLFSEDRWMKLTKAQEFVEQIKRS